MDTVGGRGPALDEQTTRLSSEADRGNFLDPGHRDQHQRNQENQAERQGEGRAEYEVVAGPIGEHGRSPRAYTVCRGRQHQRLHDGRLHQPQDRQ